LKPAGPPGAEGAVAGRGVADRGDDVGERVEDPSADQLTGVVPERRADDLHQPAGRVAALGVDVPLVDGVGVPAGLVGHLGQEVAEPRWGLVGVAERCEGDVPPLAGPAATTTGPDYVGDRDPDLREELSERALLAEHAAEQTLHEVDADAQP
jgi:hypothetical protein